MSRCREICHWRLDIAQLPTSWLLLWYMISLHTQKHIKGRISSSDRQYFVPLQVGVLLRKAPEGHLLSIKALINIHKLLWTHPLPKPQQSVPTNQRAGLGFAAGSNVVHRDAKWLLHSCQLEKMVKTLCSIRRSLTPPSCVCRCYYIWGGSQFYDMD